jgi:hypothetical protein
MAAWVRPTAVDGYRDVAAHGYRRDSTFGLALRIYSDAYQFTYWDSSDHLASAAIPSADVGAWVHLCGVLDGAGYYVYRNGVLAASLADTTTRPADVDAIRAIDPRAPQAGSGVDYPLLGQGDDVRIHGRALSAAEVESLYRS